MKLDETRSPDPLRRFIATPYVFVDSPCASRRSVRSNDLELALAVRRSWGNRADEELPPVVTWHLIRDVSASNSSAEIIMVSAGEIRALMVGTGTILLYDVQRLELLGFISSAITIERLASDLLPALLRAPKEQIN